MLELRLLEDDDISLVKTWLNKEHVKRWYEIPDMGITIEDWIEEIKQRNHKFHWITYQIAMWKKCPIGLCQYYKCRDSKEENFGVLPLANTYGIDYFIGEESFLGKGLGKQMVNRLVDMIFDFPDALRVTADIDIHNIASSKTLFACGFRLVEQESSRYVIDKNKELCKQVHFF